MIYARFLGFIHEKRILFSKTHTFSKTLKNTKKPVFFESLKNPDFLVKH